MFNLSAADLLVRGPLTEVMLFDRVLSCNAVLQRCRLLCEGS